MKKISDQQNKNGDTEPSSPERRTFVKGIAAMGAGVAAFPLLTNTAEAQVPAAADSGIPSRSSRAALQVPLTFQGDKIDWHGFDRYDFVMDKQTLAITPSRHRPANSPARSETRIKDSYGVLSLWPSRRLPATRGPVAARTGITSPRPRSNYSNGVFTWHTFRSTQARVINGIDYG